MRISDWSSDVCSSDLFVRDDIALDGVVRPFVDAVAAVGGDKDIDGAAKPLGHGERARFRAIFLERAERRWILEGRDEDIVAGQLVVERQPDLVSPGDRKSTRLNSSH